MAWILQYVWPIVDESYTEAERIKAARAELDEVADRSNAIITGPPTWATLDAADVPGWTAHRGRVLIAWIPVDVYGPVRIYRRADPQPDHAVVERLIAGNPPANVRPIERTAAMGEMYRRGAEVGAIASRLGVLPTTAERGIGRDRERTRQLTPA